MNYKLPILLVCSLVLASGCVGPLTFEAQEPQVNKSVIDDESYELNNTDTVEVTRTRTVGGSERELTVTNRLKTYDKKFDTEDIQSLDAQKVNDTLNLSRISIDEILEKTDSNISDYVTAEEIASLDPALTEDTVRRLLEEEDVNASNILERSNLSVEELVTSEELIEKVRNSDLVNQENLQANGVNLSEAPVATYVVFSTPSVAVAGQEYNPLLEQEDRKTVQQIKSRTDYDFTVNNKKDTFTVERDDGEEVRVSVFNITTEYSGVNVEGELLVTKYRVDNSVVLSVGAYPAVLDERDSIERLIKKTSVRTETDE